jgi:hypothetical protein
MSIEARRRTPRVPLRETAYVNFGSGNRGIILDVSEGGLRFKTNAPIDKSDSVRFWLTLSRNSEGAAQVAWTDESRTSGGLRFTTVPPEIREQIRDWIERAGSDDPKRQAAISALQKEEEALDTLLIESVLAVAETQAPDVSTFDVASATAGEPSGAESFDSVAHTDPQDYAKPATSYSTPFSHTTNERISSADLFQKPRPALLGEDESLSMFRSESTSSSGVMFNAPARKSHPIAVSVLVLLVVLGAAAVGGEYYYPSQARALMGRAQAKVEQFINPDHKQSVTEVEPASMAGSSRFEGSFEPGKPTENASVVPATPPAPASAQSDANSTIGSNNENEQQSDSSHSSAGAPAAEISAPKTNAETELELAQSYLAEGTSPDQQAKAVELLWLATERGNVDAEIQLADLYATGEAVQKSCVQARILLKAAAASNPGAAKAKIDALDHLGCS